MYSNKVTSSMFGVDVNEFKDDPIMGRGRYRQTGQKIGEIIWFHKPENYWNCKNKTSNIVKIKLNRWQINLDLNILHIIKR